MNWRTCLGVSVVALSVACAETEALYEGRHAEARWTSATAWRLSGAPILEIRGTSDYDQPEGTPLDPVVVFQSHSGTYVVADGDQTGWDALLVYDLVGTFIRQLGREGPGPGEFRQLQIWAGNYRSDSVAAFDIVAGKYEVWSQDGTYGRSVSLSEPGQPLGIFDSGVAVTAGRITPPIIPGRTHRPILAFDLSGTLLRELGKVDWPARRSTRERPAIGGVPTIAVGRHHWYVGHLDDFVVEVRDTLGALVRVLARPYQREHLTEERREEIIEVLAERARGGPDGGGTALAQWYEQILRTDAQWDEYLPALGAIIEDAEENVWVEHYRFINPGIRLLRPKPVAWSVFDPSGVFLGELTMPPGFLPSTITSDRVLGMWQDETGIEHVQVYALRKPE